MLEPNNDTRADWAENAVNEFGIETYGGRTFTDTVVEQPSEKGDAYTMIQDLITDLLHLAKRHGWDTERMIHRAVFNFEDEVDEEDQGDGT